MEEDKQTEYIPQVPIKDGQSLFKGLVYDEKDQVIGKGEGNEGNNKLGAITWTEFDKIDLPKQEWMIKNLIPSEGIVILASISGEKKTWLALEMAKSISSGINFLNSEEFPTKKRKALYIDMEMSKSELQKRGRQLGLNVSGDNLIIISKDNLNLNKEEDVDELLDFIRSQEIKFVVIDTFRAVSGGLKEEKAEEVREFFNRLKPLKNEGVVLMFLDHLRKPQRLDGKEPKKEHLLASQDKVASAEILLMIKSESGKDDIFTYQRKNRLSKEIEPFKITMVDEILNDGLLKTSLIYGGSFITEKESKIDQAKELIPTLLEDGDKTTGEIAELLMDQMRIGEKNAKEAIRELANEGVIQASKKGRENLYKLSGKEQSNMAS